MAFIKRQTAIAVASDHKRLLCISLFPLLQFVAPRRSAIQNYIFTNGEARQVNGSQLKPEVTFQLQGHFGEAFSVCIKCWDTYVWPDFYSFFYNLYAAGT